MEVVIKCPCCSEDFLLIVDPYIHEYDSVLRHLSELKTSIEDLNRVNVEKIAIMTKNKECEE